MSDPICVIGGGIAGICCIQTLAEQLPDKEIRLITASNLVKVTSNIERLSLNLVRFEVENQNLEQFQTNYPNVKVIIDQVVHLDATNKRIKLLKSDECINYDRLAICTGASPKPLINIESNLTKAELDQYCCLIRDTETVKELEKKFSKSKRVCVLGNGGIATELVFSIRFCKLVWIIRDPHITSTFLDAGAAHFLRSFISTDDRTANDESGSLSSKVIKRLKYTIIESEHIANESTSDTNYGSALGPDWQQKIELKGQYFANSKAISFEKNCELAAIQRFDELTDECRRNLGEGGELYRDEANEERWPIYVRLTNHKVIGCDLLINAIGVRANSFSNIEQNDSSNALQLAPDGGILVDRLMRTNLPDVYAAGDCCTPYTNRLEQVDWLTGEIEMQFKQNQIQTEHWHQIRLWTQARQMGIFMANSIAIAVKKQRLEDVALHSCFDLFTHITSFFGFKVILIGLFNGQHLDDRYEMLVRVEENKQYVKVLVKDGKLKGCILIGDTDLEETFENLIINQLDISDIKETILENIVDLEDYFD